MHSEMNKREQRQEEHNKVETTETQSTELVNQNNLTNLSYIQDRFSNSQQQQRLSARAEEKL
jgi:hypothetical protein